MLYKIRCNQMHHLYGALPVPYVPVRVTRFAVIPHRYTYAPASCRTSQYRRIRIRWCRTGGFQRQGQCIFIGLAARSLFVSCCFPFLLFHSMGFYCGAGIFGLIGSYLLSPSLAFPTFFNNNNNNNIRNHVNANIRPI